MNATQFGCIPAQLWIGNFEAVEQKVEAFLKRCFCNHVPFQETCFCSSCSKVSKRQHESIRWFSPQPLYTLESFETLFHISSFALEEQEQFFFIIEKAHTLSTSIANKLLKLLEEPPRGYYFILCSPVEEKIIQTIRSRCATTIITEKENNTPIPELLSYFLSSNNHKNVFSFEEELSKTMPHETETMDSLNIVLKHLALKIQEAISNEEKEYLRLCIKHVQFHSTMLPQAGSGPLFWKHFFLTYPHRNAL